MAKRGCSMSEVAAEKKLKGSLDEFDEDEAVNNDEFVGFHGDPSDYKIGFVNKDGGPASLEIFPPEVWEIIVESLVKSEDIYNVLLAFPELDKLFQRKKPFWLFGAVLPHLMSKHLVTEKRIAFKVTSVQCEDLFKLRLVSKRWKASVESSLRRHTELQHLPPSTYNNSEDHQKALSSENHFNYHPLQDAKLGASIFRTTQQLSTVIANVSGNPFPGKYVDIKIADLNMIASLALFEKFGKDILFLGMELNGGPHCHLQLCQTVLKCLSNSPNLRSVTFTGILHASADNQTSDLFCQPEASGEASNLFPDLPNLEAFNWQVSVRGEGDLVLPPSRWITGMLQKYGGQDGLGKLGVPVLLCLHWYLPSNLSRSLSELTLFGKSSEVIGLEYTKFVFKTLTNPQKLRKLRLQNWGRLEITKLLIFLAGFKVESLVLEDVNLEKTVFKSQNEALNAAEMKAESITSLHFLDDGGFSYDFLKWLPNLQFVTINYKFGVSWGWRVHFRKGVKPGDSLAKRITAFVLKACDKSVEISGNEEFSIWRELPKLEMLRVKVLQKSREEETEDSVWDLQFVRECGDKAFFFGGSHGRNGVKVLHEDVEEEDDDW